MRYYHDAGFDGLFVNGTLAEGMSLSSEERMKTAEKWMRLAEGLPVILHIGTGNLKETQDLARHAESLGVDGISALPPTYHKPPSEELLADYLAEVAAAAPNTPFLYYEYDVASGVYMNISKLLNMVEDRIPTFYGLKHTTADLNSALNCTLACNRKYKIFYGTETLFLPSLSLGIPDCITSAYMGQFFRDVKYSVAKGDLKSAQAAQVKALQLKNIQNKYGGDITSAKAMFELISGVKVGGPRLPLPTMESRDMQLMKADLVAGGFIKESTVKGM
ncbi:N-acetylneuraminate lyase-like isoform X2 [Mya arenaria]|nr:N-acetylneuraminate lyase-like isoform X2 [Mya arenaria]XP_052789735.1 N-acetylneuraminate lyase-like isoform X2 [Mya arenaria]XP_052789736.1 N-acetylneuraminate lyase-like isoform X2 [Mya arenaria]XP_052789737.1 N-acetylneuraminate lyase-like isoform X2 [Mya arenaria]